MKTIKYFILIFFISIFLNSCKKSEGEGGNSSIKGKVLVKEYNETFTVLKGEYYAQGEDVYIVYGGKTQVGDRIETYYDGSFQFDYLRKGNYKIYVYSEDMTLQSVSGDVVVEKDVQILSNGETVEMEDIVIYSTSKDNYTSSITGKVYVEDVNSIGNPTGNNYYAYDEDVFLVRGNDTLLYDDCKTNYNGNYYFDKLPIGTYKVYAYTKVFVSGVQQEDEPVIVEVNITANNQSVTAPEIKIKK